MSKHAQSSSPMRPLLWLAVALALGFLLLPILGLFVVDQGEVLSELDATSPLLRSLWVAGLATALALAAGLPLAWWLARTSFKGRVLIRALVTLPLVLPPVVSGVALIGVFGRGGMLGLDLAFSEAALVLAAAYVAFPFFVLSAEAGFRRRRRELEEAAATLGASNWRIFHAIALPQAKPMLLAGLVLTFARAIGEFGATVTFAGNFSGRRTLPLEIFFQIEARADFAAAVLIAQVLLSVSLGLVLLISLFNKDQGRLSQRSGRQR